MAKHTAKSEVELNLTVLCMTALPGQSLPAKDIAEFCGCSDKYINFIARKALEKLKKTHQNNSLLKEYLED